MRRTQPLYLSVADRLEQDIATGRYAVTSFLPTESELCKMFRASRFTVREAVKRLQARGLVVTRHGTGTEVLAKEAKGGRFIYSFESVSELIQSARSSRLANIRSTEVQADSALAKTLNCAAGDPLLRVRALRVVPGARGRPVRPIALTELHVPWRYADIRDQLERIEGTVGELIERQYGLMISRIEQTVTPYTLNTEEARNLQVEPRSLGLHFERTYISSDGEPFEYVKQIQAGDEARLSMTIRAREG